MRESEPIRLLLPCTLYSVKVGAYITFALPYKIVPLQANVNVNMYSNLTLAPATGVIYLKLVLQKHLYSYQRNATVVFC